MGGAVRNVRLGQLAVLSCAIFHGCNVAEVKAPSLSHEETDTTAPLLSGIAATSITATSALIVWTTDEAADSIVEYGTTVSYGGSTPLFGLTTSHATTLGGLAAATLYHFRVKSRDAAGNLATSTDLAFTTATSSADSTPPTVSLSFPAAGSTVAGNVTVSATASDNTGVVGVQFLLDGNNLGSEDMAAPYSTVWSSTLTANGSHTLSARARDASGNQTISVAITVTVQQDITPPVMSNGAPSAVLPAGTTQTTMSLTTNEAATCKWASSNVAYANMTNAFTTTGGTSHSTTLTGLANGQSYNCYVRCQDGAGNANTASYSISFSVAAPSTTITIGETNVVSRDDYGNGNLLIAQAATLSQTATLMSLSFYVTTASGDLRLGVYDASGPSGGPGVKKAETAALAPVVGWNTAPVVTPVSLTAGTYWLAYLPSSSGLHFRAESTGAARFYAYSYGALPATFSTTPSSDVVHWSFYATFSVTTVADTTPPVLSNGAPSAALPAGTTQTTMSVTTNEAATCKWATSNVAYGSMTNTFTTTGGTSHSTTLNNLANGQNYTRYVRCQDTAGNANGTSYAISFSVANATDTTAPSTPTGLSSSVSSCSEIDLSWTSSTDTGGSGLRGYRIYRGGVFQVEITSTSLSDSGLSASTSYSYAVSAIDNAGNESALSASVSGSTPACTPVGCPGFVIEGFGQDTTGGCGGVTLVVDTLNDVDDSSATTASGLLSNRGSDGRISLREAIDVSGPRIVKFSISGWIDLALSGLDIRRGDITIDGSDAPNGGVGVQRGSFWITGHNVIVRHMRFQAGELGSTNIGSLAIGSGDLDLPSGSIANHVVIDHVTACWGDDGDLDIVNGASDITVQWSLMCENMGPGATLHSYGATRVTYHHNLYANGGSNRNPVISGGEVDLVNNVVYRNFNFGGDPNRYFENLNGIGFYSDPSGFNVPVRINIVGNYYKPGPAERTSPNHPELYLYNGGSPYGGANLTSQSLLYFSGNIGPNRPSDDLAENALAQNEDGTLPPMPLSPTRLSHPLVSSSSASQAYADVLAAAGATLPCRSASDERVVAYVQAGGGETAWGYTNPIQVGGWPSLVCTP